MATIKAIHGAKSLKIALKYVTNPDKAEVITGVNCNADTALEEMETTKNIYNKTGGRTYIHLVQSWHQDEDFFDGFDGDEKEKLKNATDKEILKAKAQKANKIAQKLIKNLPLFEGHEVLIATHIDRQHIHNHIIINSVNCENGYKFQSSAHDLQVIKDKSDEICKEYGLTVTEKGKTFEGLERDETSTYNKEARWVQVQAEKKNIKSYIRDIGIAILKARDKARNKTEFIAILGKDNIGVNWSDTRKNITFVDRQREQDGEKKYKVRDKTLNEYFDLGITKEALENGFKVRVRRNEDERTTNERIDTNDNKSTEPNIETARIEQEIIERERRMAEIKRKRKEEEDRERATKDRERELEERKKQNRMATKAKQSKRSRTEETNRGYGR